MSAVRRHTRLAVSVGTLAVLAGLLAGCVSQETAQADARAAFYAGQAQALAQQHQQHLQQAQQSPTITVNGNVANTRIEWVKGLTLVRALIEAAWLGTNDPKSIIVRRSGTSIQIDPKDLILDNSEGPELLPGDVIELRQ